MRKGYLISVCILLASFDAQAKELETRIEVNTRLGTERSIVMTELWHPLTQDYGSVLYTDIRLMGDNDSNSEFNIGVGHRHVTNRSTGIFGVNGWFDRRQTERGSVFYQVTGGYEYFTVNNDLRINAYLPFDQQETYSLPASGASAPYLAGTGIFYDTNGSLTERPMKGADIEFGHRFNLPFAPETNFRAAAGAFHFNAEDVQSVSGGRLKLTADITPDFQVGTRFEKDSARGSQGFIEATLRFPFGAKAAHNTLAIRDRLDESPERDIDIISGSKIDTGRMKPVISTVSGQAQRVFYVDNTASVGGDGSLENPFNNLAAANTAITHAGDIIYIFAGDGTTNNYDTHVELTRTGQSLIGSGSAFVYDSGRFSASHTGSFNGTTLLAAGARPTITNTLGSCDVGGCGAVYINADDILLSGFTAANALNTGINIVNSSNTTITNVTTENNGGFGILAYQDDGQTRSFNLDGFTTTGNGAEGFYIESSGAGSIWDGVTLDNISASGNRRGIFFQASTGGSIRNISVSNSSASNHSAEGFVFNAPNGTIENVTLDNLYAENSFNGILVQTGGVNGLIRNVDINNSVTTMNTADGIRIRNNSGALIENINISNHQANNNINASNGISLNSNDAGSIIRAVDISDSTISGNIRNGIALSGTGAISDITISNSTTNNNAQTGIAIASGNNSIRNNIVMSNITASNNTQNGIGIGAGATGATISNVTLDTATLNGNTNGVALSTGLTGNLATTNLRSLTINNSIQNGISVLSNGSGNLDNLNISDTTITASGTNGLNISQTNSSTQNNIFVDNVSIDTSTATALTASTAGTGSINNLAITSSSFTNSGTAGVYLRSLNTSNFSGSMEGSTVTGSGTNGIFFDDDATGTYNFDLGGGGTSAGNNRIFGNAGTELRVDLDGAQLKAENNWWGNAAGLAPGEVTLEVGSTVDSTPFLNADPGP